MCDKLLLCDSQGGHSDGMTGLSAALKIYYLTSPSMSLQNSSVITFAEVAGYSDGEE